MGKILLVNECESDNLGDLAIAESLEDKVSNLDFSTKKAAFSSIIKKNKEVTITKKVKSNVLSSKLLTVKSWVASFKWLILNFARVQAAFAGVDRVIIGGGQLILSNPQFPLALFLWVISSRIRSIPIYIVGVGCGGSFSFFEKKIIKLALNKVDKIYLRDSVSLANLEKNFSVTANLSFDCAYTTHLSKDKCEKIGIVSVISYSVFERYAGESGLNIKNKEEYFLNWVERINALKVEKLIFISTTHLDCLETNQFLDEYSDLISFKFEVFSQLTTLAFYESVLSSASVVLSARMHSLILGENYGCKIEPWIISEKLKTYTVSYSQFTVSEKESSLNKALRAVLNEK